GQVHLLISVGRRIARNGEEFAEFVAWALEDFWPRARFHLRMDIADAAGWCREVSEEIKQRVIRGLEERLDNNDFAINTPIMESLGQLGGLDEMEVQHEAAVRDELDSILNGPVNPEAQQAAYRFYNCQFDHPYSNAYCTVVNELSKEQR